jgi:hypothetical protein
MRENAKSGVFVDERIVGVQEGKERVCIMIQRKIESKE